LADFLEAEWNNQLRALATAQEDYERQRAGEVGMLDEQQRQHVLALATDFPRLWHDPATPHRERKRMVRLLIEDVTLLKADEVVAHVRFRGGVTHTLRLPRPRPAVQLHKIDPAVVAEIDRLLDTYTDREIAEVLNSRGLQPGVADSFSPWMIWRLRTRHGLEDRCSRLRRQGLLTLQEMATALGVHPATAQQRQARGAARLRRLQRHGPAPLRAAWPAGDDCLLTLRQANARAQHARGAPEVLRRHLPYRRL